MALRLSRTTRRLGLRASATGLPSIAVKHCSSCASFVALHESAHSTPATCGDCELGSAYGARAVAQRMPPKGRI